MLHTLSPENLENAAAHILQSNMQNFWEFRALARQIVYKAMASPDETAAWSQSSVALINAISGGDAHVVGATKPLGGSSGPGKAFRFALLQECFEVFEEAMAHVDYVCFLPTDHPDYLQASKRIWAFGYVLCAFVNWKLLRDTALNCFLERLLRITYCLEDVPMVCVELAANTLQYVDPWMNDNWGYASNRYLDGYYFRIQHWCKRQIFVSKMPEGYYVDVPFCYDVLDKVIKPRVQWINQKREEMACALELPAVDVGALEATGRSRVPSMAMDPTPTSPTQLPPHQPIQEVLSKTERVYASGEDPSFFAFPLLPVDNVAAPFTNTFDDDTATTTTAAPATAAAPAAGPSPAPTAAPSPAAGPSPTPAAARSPAPAAASSPGPAAAPFPAPAAAPISTTAAISAAAQAPTAAAPPLPATAAGPASTTTAATVPTADDSSIAATAGVVDSASDPPINDIPTDIIMSSDSASSQSADSVYAPRSRASSGSSGTSPRDAANSPDSRSSTHDHATSSDSHSNVRDSANSSGSRSSNQSTRAPESVPRAERMHTHEVNDRAPYRLPMSTHKEKPGSVNHSARSSQLLPVRGYGRTHAHTHVQEVPMRNSSAQLDAMSRNHPNGARASKPHPFSEAMLAEDRANLSEAVSRALQEFMLSHDSSEFVESLQVLLGHGNAAAVLQTLLQSATAKLEQLSKPKPLSKSTPLPRSRKALQRHFEEQRDRMFCKGGVIIDPLAVDVKQYGEAKRRRSGLGLQIPPSNPGYKLMTRWGWQEGQGLGANLQGRTEPRLPTYQPRGDDKQGLGELRYKGMLQGDAAADQLRGLLVEVCSGESAVLGGEAVQQGIHAFLTNSPPHATPNAPPLRVRTLCWVGSVLGALVYNGSLTGDQASDLVTNAARASAGPGGSNTLQRLIRNMWAAVSKQRRACRRAEEEAQQAKQKEAEQLAELHQPRAPTKKTTYVQGAEGKALKIKIKQYGVSSSAAPSSDGRVSWE